MVAIHHLGRDSVTPCSDHRSLPTMVALMMVRSITKYDNDDDQMKLLLTASFTMVHSVIHAFPRNTDSHLSRRAM
jgi:hypothetical protein